MSRRSDVGPSGRARWREADPDLGPATGRVGRLDAAPVSFGGLAGDREPETGARLPAGVVGPVEALEDVRQVGGRETRAVIAPGEDAVVEGQFDHAARRAPLDRVVEQVRDGAVDAVRLATHEGRLELGAEVDVDAVAALRPPDQDGNDAIDADVVEYPSRLAAASELD